MNVTHTPAPYYVIEHPNGWTIQTRATGAGECVAMQYADAPKETADFIVKACNSHGKVIEVLKAVRDLIQADRHIPLFLVEMALFEAGEPV